jgi:hypothetical protein
MQGIGRRNQHLEAVLLAAPLTQRAQQILASEDLALEINPLGANLSAASKKDKARFLNRRNGLYNFFDVIASV